MAETQFAEVFPCPVCGGANYVQWGPKEAKREIACIHHGVEKTIDQQSVDAMGESIVIPLTYNEGFRFTVTRQAGDRGTERELAESGSWTEKRAVSIGKAQV